MRNAGDGQSLIGTAESAIGTYTDILQRLRELAIQSANDTNSASNRQALNLEVQQQLEELQRIATTVEFNGTKLLDGSFVAKQLQVGSQANQTISITTGNLQTSQIGMVARHTSTAVPGTTGLSTGDLVLNGIDLGSTSADGVSTVGSTASARAIVNAINAKTSEHGVTATVVGTTAAAANAVAASTLDGTTQQLTINGVDIFTSSLTVAAGDGTGTLCDAINSKSNQTGVTATVDENGKLVLEADDGRNVQVTTAGSIGDELGLEAANGDHSHTYGGTYLLTADEEIVVQGANTAFAGLAVSTYGLDSSTAINMLDISTVNGANLAIDMVDNALNQINGVRAGLGAITNRLDQTVANLESISENLSASNSRIVDADFAAETANLTKNQILQQAGIAILSQANTTTESVLQLLK